MRFSAKAFFLFHSQQTFSSKKDAATGCSSSENSSKRSAGTEAAVTCIRFTNLTLSETGKVSEHSVASELGPAAAQSEQHVALKQNPTSPSAPIRL